MHAHPLVEKKNPSSLHADTSPRLERKKKRPSVFPSLSRERKRQYHRGAKQQLPQRLCVTPRTKYNLEADATTRYTLLTNYWKNAFLDDGEKAPSSRLPLFLSLAREHFSLGCLCTDWIEGAAAGRVYQGCQYLVVAKRDWLAPRRGNGMLCPAWGRRLPLEPRHWPTSAASRRFGMQRDWWAHSRVDVGVGCPG